jgi:predicted membrane protein
MGNKLKLAKKLIVGAMVVDAAITLRALKKFNHYKVQYQKNLWMSQQKIDLSHAIAEDASYAVALSDLLIDLRYATFSEHYTTYLIRADYAHIKILLPDNVQLQFDGVVKCARAIHDKGQQMTAISKEKYLIIQYDLSYSSLEVIGGA